MRVFLRTVVLFACALALAAPAAAGGRRAARKTAPKIGKAKQGNSNRAKKTGRRMMRHFALKERLQQNGAKPENKAVKKAQGKEDRATKRFERELVRADSTPRATAPTKGEKKAKVKAQRLITQLSQQMGGRLSPRTERILLTRIAGLTRRLQPGTKFTVRNGELRGTDNTGDHHVIRRLPDGRVTYTISGQIMFSEGLQRSPRDARSALRQAAGN